MKKPFENAPSSPELKREVTLDCEKLKIADPAQLEKDLTKLRSRALNAVNSLENYIKDGKIRSSEELSMKPNPIVADAEEKIGRAKELGIDITDLEEKFKQCLEKL